MSECEVFVVILFVVRSKGGWDEKIMRDRGLTLNEFFSKMRAESVFFL